MKSFIIPSLLLCLGCAGKADLENEKFAISKVIDSETQTAASGDSANWRKHWITDDESRFTITDAGGSAQYQGWDEIEGAMRHEMQSSKLELKRQNYHYSIDDDIAFVSFDQSDNWGGIGGRKTSETRTLKKVNGDWKITHSNVIVLSSFAKAAASSFHMAKEEIPVDSKSSLRSVSGLGGMYVGFIEVPGGTDFTPMFKGLPHDMCPSPHWGYMLEGEARIKYADGKEELIRAGEVFYLPAPHTGFAEKDVKFIDFSPEEEMNVLIEHLSKASKN